MLTPESIAYMKNALDDIYTLRKRPITLIYYDEEKDVTGVIIGKKEVTKDIEAVVTEISSLTPDLTIEDKRLLDEADVKIDAKIEDVSDILNRIEKAEYNGHLYEILSKDLKGIGLRNRVEMLARKVV